MLHAQEPLDQPEITCTHLNIFCMLIQNVSLEMLKNLRIFMNFLHPHLGS